MAAEQAASTSVAEGSRRSRSDSNGSMTPSGTNMSTFPPTMTAAMDHHQPVWAASATVRAMPAKGTRLYEIPQAGA